MSRYIRKFDGVPPLSQFDFNEGTPLVIDTNTGFLYYSDQNIVKQVNVPDSNIVYGEWRFDSATAASDPGAGDVRVNNVVFASATAIYISQTSHTGADTAPVLAALKVNDTIHLYEKGAGADHVAKYHVSGAVIDNGAWFTIPVSYISHAGAIFANNSILTVALGIAK